MSHFTPKTFSMASTNSELLLFLTSLIFIISSNHISALEFQVGGIDGWIVPPKNDTNYYNDWASQNRFRLSDMINFKYKKDAVMEVREGDYKTCNSTHPLFYSNTGNTVYKLRSKRAYYFISGVAGHCEMGQKVIIKVLAADEAYDEDGSGADRSGGGRVGLSVGGSQLLIVPLVVAAPFMF